MPMLALLLSRRVLARSPAWAAWAWLALLAPGAGAAEAPLSFDISTRAASRAYYRSIYNASEGVPIAWTGTLAGNFTSATGTPGDTAAAFKESVRLRINWFRAAAGVPAVIALNPAFSVKNQQAALMMSANNQLSHFPPNTWQLYTADGADAADSSNIALGSRGADSVTAYIWEYGASNAAVGHRRWLLYPQSTTMGTGDIPATGAFLAANTIWVIDPATYFNSRPTTRENFVAWPPPGFVPYPVVFPRWSVSYPGANFTAATVTMTRNGSPIPVQLAPVTDGFGENTLVWVPDNLPDTTTPPANPGADALYQVTVNGATVGGSPLALSYNVTVFDPAVAGPGDNPAAVSGPASIFTGVAANFTASVPAFAPDAQWRPLSLAATGNSVWNGTTLNGAVAVTTGNYSLIDAGRFHLAHPTTATQTLTLPGIYYAPAGGNATLTFQSMLGFATANQTARAQISLDEGMSWVDLYAQSGTGTAGETSFQPRSASLAPYAGRTFQIRFIYVFSSGSFFNQTASGVGWYLDNITLANVQAATPGAATLAGGAGFSVTPGAAGPLRLQARGMLFGQFPLDWGPVAAFTVSDPPPPAPRELWRQAHFSSGQLANAAISGDGADPDLDGLTNLLEYALDTDPLANSSAFLPVAQVASGQLRLAYTPLRSDLTYAVQASTDLENWTTTGVSTTADGAQRLASFNLASAPGGRIFLRLLVTVAP